MTKKKNLWKIKFLETGGWLKKHIPFCSFEWVIKDNLQSWRMGSDILESFSKICEMISLVENSTGKINGNMGELEIDVSKLNLVPESNSEEEIIPGFYWITDILFQTETHQSKQGREGGRGRGF